MVIINCTWSCLKHDATPSRHFSSALISSQFFFSYFLPLPDPCLCRFCLMWMLWFHCLGLRCKRLLSLDVCLNIHVKWYFTFFELAIVFLMLASHNYEFCIAQVKQTPFQTPHKKKSQFSEDSFVARQQAWLLLVFWFIMPVRFFQYFWLKDCNLRPPGDYGGAHGPLFYCFASAWVTAVFLFVLLEQHTDLLSVLPFIHFFPLHHHLFYIHVFLYCVPSPCFIVHYLSCHIYPLFFILFILIV